MDLAAAVLVFVVAFASGLMAIDSFTRAGKLPQYYQREFGARRVAGVWSRIRESALDESPSSDGASPIKTPAPGFESPRLVSRAAARLFRLQRTAGQASQGRRRTCFRAPTDT